MSVVAVIGVGTMGAPMARQVHAGGHELRLFDQHAPAAEALAGERATVCGSAAEAADGAGVALLSLPGPPEVAAAVDGVLAAGAEPGVIVDLSTNSVAMVRELRERCAAAGVAFLDAPVSGGVAGAEAGTLTVMVGGEADEVAAVEPVLDHIAGTVMHVGPSGAGAIAKLVNNHVFLTGAQVVQEAYVLGQALGMDANDLHKIVAASSGGPYARLAPLILGRAFDDVIFRMDIAAKDLELAAESAEAVGAPVPLAAAAIDRYRSALEAGLGDKVFHATLLDLEADAGVELPKVERPPKPDKG